jgi:N-acetylglucosaminyldiphosphoundecaprenol N-acetyl-beta-D-mannosaminyltransferase
LLAGIVFLLGACEGIAATAARALCDANPALHVCGTFAGSPATIDEEHILEKIRAASPRMLFVAFGAPNQELWIARNLAKMPSVKVAMGVGGAFDFIAGKQKRAPQIFRSLGLEWLYRLMREPRRIVRIINAVVVFPFLVITRDR